MSKPTGYGWYLKMLSNCIESHMNRYLQSRNLTFSQLKVLRYLASCPQQSATLKEIEGELHSAQSTASGLAVRLEQKDFVHSCQDPSDKRVKHIQLTPSGQEACLVCHMDMLATEEQLVQLLDPQEQAMLLSFLQRMLQSMTADLPSTSSFRKEEHQPC